MKTIREYIDLIENAQFPAKPIIAWVEPATCSTMSNDQYENNPFANETGDWKPIHTQEELAVWQDRREEKKRGQALGQNPVAEDQTTRTCPTCDGSGEDALDPTKSCRRCGGKGYIPFPKEQGVAEALSKTDLLKQVSETYTPTAGELAQDHIKMADGDFNKKYGMSKQQANHYYSSSKLKEPSPREKEAAKWGRKSSVYPFSR